MATAMVFSNYGCVASCSTHATLKPQQMEKTQAVTAKPARSMGVFKQGTEYQRNINRFSMHKWVLELLEE